MQFVKPPLDIDGQVKLLIERGMLGDPAKMRRRLASVSYYRLSGYWHHRKLPDSENFKPDTHFDVVWERYIFDRKLRLLVMDAIERIEVGVRAQFAEHHTAEHGALGYAEDPTALPKLDTIKRGEQLHRVDEEVRRSKELFIEHFKRKYGDNHRLPPLWMATEIMSFNCALSLWQGSSKKVKNQVARHFGVNDKVLKSWLWSLNETRNVCAHHGRLWNRALGNKPFLPRPTPLDRTHDEWQTPVAIPNDRLFTILTICAHSLSRLAPRSGWQGRVRRLLAQYPDVPIKNMGFPDNWLECPIWRGAADAA